MKVSDKDFLYLRIQKGEIARFANDFPLWKKEYERALNEQFLSMRSYLPETCSSILDVGGGMGGIDILLNGYYGGDCEVSIIDGRDDPPHVYKHRNTFNNIAFSSRFLRSNGVEKFVPRFPGKLGNPKPYDLIISLGSWCFHYEPEVYLDFVLKCCHSKTILVIETRIQKPEWRKKLEETFDLIGEVDVRPKIERLIFKVRE